MDQEPDLEPGDSDSQPATPPAKGSRKGTLVLVGCLVAVGVLAYTSSGGEAARPTTPSSATAHVETPEVAHSGKTPPPSTPVTPPPGATKTTLTLAQISKLPRPANAPSGGPAAGAPGNSAAIPTEPPVGPAQPAATPAPPATPQPGTPPTEEAPPPTATPSPTQPPVATPTPELTWPFPIPTPPPLPPVPDTDLFPGPASE